MGWWIFGEHGRKDGKGKKSPSIQTVEELTRPKEKMVEISEKELEQLKEKARQYDWLITGENGNFLRRNGIIK